MFKSLFKRKPKVSLREVYSPLHRTVAQCVETTRKQIVQKTCVQDALPEAIMTGMCLDFELTAYLVALISYYEKKYAQSTQVQEELMLEFEFFVQQKFGRVIKDCVTVFRNRVSEHEQRAAMKYGKLESRLSLISRVLVFQQTGEVIPGNVPPTWIAKTSDEELTALLEKTKKSEYMLKSEEETDESVQGLRLLVDLSDIGLCDSPWNTVYLNDRGFQNVFKNSQNILALTEQQLVELFSTHLK